MRKSFINHIQLKIRLNKTLIELAKKVEHSFNILYKCLLSMAYKYHQLFMLQPK